MMEMFDPNPEISTSAMLQLELARRSIPALSRDELEKRLADALETNLRADSIMKQAVAHALRIQAANSAKPNGQT